MERLNYISLEQAINIHAKTIKYSGGGICRQIDVGKLDSVLQHIRNDEYYPTFSKKLTHLFFCTCQFHCFADGNKRLAITLSTQFLLINGYMSIAKSFMGEMENISYHVASGKIDKELLERIIESILNKSYDSDESLKLEILNAIQ